MKDIFYQNKQGFESKSRALTHFVAFEEHMADKCHAKPPWSLLLTALYHLVFVYMRRINYDSATVNIPIFIEQRNISFQNDISLKTMRLGVLSAEKLKNRETHGRIVSLDQLGSWRAIADLFVMFIPWQVKKLQKFINVCLKVGYSANLKHSKSTRRQLIAPWKCTKFEQNHNIKSSGHNALLDRRTGMIDLRLLSFWYRAHLFRAD